MKKPQPYLIIFLVLALFTALIVYWTSMHLISQEKATRSLKLERANQVAATELKEALNAHAVLLSGIKAYININDSIPKDTDLKGFLSNQLKDLTIDPPFSVTRVDTNHVIVDDLVFKDVKKIFLKGTPMNAIIGAAAVKRMDSVMRRDNFYASNPTNLLEGEVGLPIVFGLLDDNGNSQGYITSVALFAPIVERAYQTIDKESYVLSFKSKNGNFFDRTRSYNTQKIYTTEKDPEYFKNFDVSPEQYVYSKVYFYNNTFTIGTAFKEPYKYSLWKFLSPILWYVALLGFILFLITRFYIYQRENKIIAAQRRRLIELVATKNKFFNMIAHDLRNPLTSVVNFLDLLRDDGTDSATNMKIVEALGDSSKTSLTLLDNLLKWSKVQTGNISFNIEEIDLVKIVTDQIHIQKHIADDKNVQIDLECSFNGRLRGDKNLMGSVIRNLLSNAIKFSHNGGVVVVDISKKDSMASISVEDNGIGIPKELLDKLFDITEVTTQKGTSNEKGSGIGLVLSKQFVEMHEGTLAIESEESRGTLVEITLPLHL